MVQIARHASIDCEQHVADCLGRLGLTAVDLAALAAQGFVSSEYRSRGPRRYGPFHKLRWRVGGVQRVRYLGRNPVLAEQVQAALAVWQAPHRAQRTSAALLRAGPFARPKRPQRPNWPARDAICMVSRCDAAVATAAIRTTASSRLRPVPSTRNQMDPDSHTPAELATDVVAPDPAQQRREVIGTYRHAGLQMQDPLAANLAVLNSDLMAVAAETVAPVMELLQRAKQDGVALADCERWATLHLRFVKQIDRLAAISQKLEEPQR